MVPNYRRPHPQSLLVLLENPYLAAATGLCKLNHTPNVSFLAALNSDFVYAESVLIKEGAMTANRSERIHRDTGRQSAQKREFWQQYIAY